MPNPAWPTAGGFPPAPLDGQWTRQRQPNTIEFAPDAGPPEVRRRSTVSVVTASFSIMLTEAQLPALDTFFNDCAEGAAPFDWTNPETGQTEAWFFAAPPVVTHRTGSIYTVQIEARRNS